ncbi:Monooxygenase aurF [Colletotrichum sidae]|uniref:Monooxygenase aurF n=1 Tax=Colletotrichum sidae TaxID=1347389 RepID=A0A4R8TAH9_9PEZI|nr:Monooxygenase aurF [Colletotrichum sidae]
MNEEGPIDSVLMWRTARLGLWLEYHFLNLLGWASELVFKKNAKVMGDQDPDWEFEPSPSLKLSPTVIVVNDDMFSRFREGCIRSEQGVRRIVGPRALELSNGKVIEDVDVIIAASGYRPDFSLVSDLSHIVHADPELPPLPDLTQNFFSVNCPGSLACVSYCTANETAATYRELQVMTVAQIWTGNSQVPSRDEMHRHTAAHQTWLWKRLRAFPSIPLGLVQAHTLFRFIQHKAGTGMYEYMGWGWRRWSFWWQDRALYRLVAWGANTPFMYRLFETGKRRAWAD